MKEILKTNFTPLESKEILLLITVSARARQKLSLRHATL